MSPSRRSTVEPAQLRAAQACAAGSSSTACTSLPGTSVATASAIAPDPVHRSTTRGRSSPGSAASTASTTTSVSGRGTNTPGPTCRVEVAEGRDAGDVLQRLARGPPVDVRREAGAGVVVPPQVAPLDAQRVRGEHLGVVPGRRDARRGQPVASPRPAAAAQRPAVTGRRRPAWPRCPRRRAPGRRRPRSPSSTWSRLWAL